MTRDTDALLRLERQDGGRSMMHYITKNTTLVSNCKITSIERLLFLPSGKMSLGRFYGALCSISSADTQN